MTAVVPGALEARGVAVRASDLIALRRLALAVHSELALAALPGGFTTKRKGHGLAVSDVREYVSGDDFRHLDRGTTARMGRLHVRQFHAERDRVCLLVADFRPAMFWGIRRAFRSVAVAEALALMGWHEVETGGRVGLLAITATGPVIVPPRGRVRGMLNVIGAMAEAHRDGLAAMAAGQGVLDPPLDQGLLRVDRLVPTGAELIIVSGFDTPGPELADRLDALARRRKPRLFQMTDAQINNMPRGRYPIRMADGRCFRLSLGHGTAGFLTNTNNIAGRRAVVLDAGEDTEQLARRIVGGLPLEHAA